MSFGMMGAMGSRGARLSTAQIFALQRETLTRVKVAMAAAAVSNPVADADFSPAPTITESGTHDATLSVQANVGPQGSQFWNSRGNRYIRASTSGLFIGTANQTIGTGNLTSFTGLSPTLIAGDSNYTYQAAFVTSSQIVEINLRVAGAASPFRLIVNGAYIGRTSGRANALQFVKYDFGSAASRTIIVETQGGGGALINVAVSAGQTITAMAAPSVSGIVFGDSQTEAASNGDAVKYVWDGWASVFAKMFGIGDLQNAAVGGTGYWNQSGGATGNRTRIVDQIPYWIPRYSYDVVQFAGGFNDQTQIADATTVALARQAWQSARTRSPGSLIIVYGVFGGRTGPSAGTISLENALAAEFTSWADPCSIFIPVSTDPDGAWQTGTGYVGNTNGSGNSDTWVSSDAVHLSQTGQLGTGALADTNVRAAMSALFTAFGVP